MKLLGLFFTVALLGIVFLAIVLQREEPIERPRLVFVESSAIVAGIQEKPKDVASYRAFFEMVYVAGLELRGEIVVVRPDRIRLEMAKVGNKETIQYLYSDGLTLWQYMPFFKTASKVDLAVLKQEFPTAAAHLVQKQSYIDGVFSSYAKENVKYFGQEILLDEHVIVFQAGPLPDAYDPEVAKIRAWISPKDGLPRRVEYYDSEWKLLYYQRLLLVEVNIDISSEEFRFEVPEGTTVVDATDEYRNVLNGAKKEKPPFWYVDPTKRYSESR